MSVLLNLRIYANVAIEQVLHFLETCDFFCLSLINLLISINIQLACYNRHAPGMPQPTIRAKMCDTSCYSLKSFFIAFRISLLSCIHLVACVNEVWTISVVLTPYLRFLYLMYLHVSFVYLFILLAALFIAFVICFLLSPKLSCFICLL